MIPQWLATVHHDGSEKYVSEPYPRFDDTVRIRLRVGDTAPVRRVFLRTFPDGEQQFTAMQRGAHESPAQWWEVDLLVDMPLVPYRFVIEADDGVWHYTAAGPQDYEPPDLTDFRLLADYTPVEWLAGSVFYQIFPDSFANGDPSNDPQPGDFEHRGHRPQTLPWGAPRPGGFAQSIMFYGGDLQGVAQHLDHLERLGVNAIYLNPVFTAYSNHRYDPVDYTQVDPRLGGDAALIALREALDARGMRYILDITPNHCGDQHPWFQAAQADPHAPEAEFFTFTRHPDEYLSWMGFKTLAKLNYASAELHRRMVGAPDAIFRRWLEPPFRADGWRVDVANMTGRQGHLQVNAEVAQAIRRAVKETRPDAYLMAENFYDATGQLQGDQWDAVMNYSGLTTPLKHWLRGYNQGALGFADVITSPVPYRTSALEASWRYRRAAIPWAILVQQYNLLGSHDTSRMRTLVGENDALHRLAVVVQMTFPGVPALYYGDEVGMVDGPGGVRSRGCMIWDEAAWDHDLFAFYQSLIALRRGSHTLKHGGFQTILTDSNTFAYQRESREGRVIVIAHRAADPRPAVPLAVSHAGIPDGTRFVEHFTGHDAVVQGGVLPLPALPQGATIWRTVT